MVRVVRQMRVTRFLPASEVFHFICTGEYLNGVISRVNDDGTYDVEYQGEYKWIGIQRGVRADFIRKRGDRSQKVSAWHWEDISEDEDAIWADHSDEEVEKDEESSEGKDRISFEAFNNIPLLLDACLGDEELLMAVLSRLSRTHGQISSIHKLIRLVKDSRMVADEIADGTANPSEPFDREDLVLLNIAYPPRRSGLYSLIKVVLDSPVPTVVSVSQ